MQRYQTEDEHRKAMRAKINKTIKRGKRRKRIIRRLRKAVPGICIGVLIAGMGAWCIAAPLPDPDDYEPYRFKAENGQWYTQEEYEQMHTATETCTQLWTTLRRSSTNKRTF